MSDSTWTIPALKAYFDEKFDHVDEMFQMARVDDQRAIEAALASAEKAVDKAFDASKELAAKHNDLIRAMETKDATYATKVDLDRVASFQAKLAGALALSVFLVPLVIATIFYLTK